MKYKLVALDIDGTLLNDQHQISKENHDVIQKLKTKGVRFVLVTGRPDIMAVSYLKELEIEPIILGCNGATVRNVITNELFVSEFIKDDVLTKVYDYFKKHGLYCRFYSVDKVFTCNPNEFNETLNPIAHFSKKLAESIPFLIVDNVDILIKERIIKVMFYTEDNALLMKTQKDLAANEHIQVLHATKHSIDILVDTVSKGQALLDYAKQYQIEASEIIAIGDGENDISMLSVVGCPVTVANGNQRLKEMASFISKSNNESGVAYALTNLYQLDK